MKPAAVFLLLLAAAAPAQQPAEAYLIDADGGGELVWITAATDTAIRFQREEKSSESEEAARADIGSVYLLEPPVLTEALELFQARSYAAAREKFAAVKTAYAALRQLPDNPSTVAAFHELECLRKSGDLAGFAKARDAFDKAGLTRRDQLRQLDLYTLWDAVRLKDWPRVDELAEARLKTRLPGGQRAQAAYCLGLSREARGRDREAIDAYQVALTADGGASEDLARDAALRIMRLHLKDPAVQAAIKRPGAPEENAPVPGRLLEAAAMAELFELSLGAGTPLPAEEKVLLKYRVKP